MPVESVAEGTGAEAVARVLAKLGVPVIFGVPGTQSMDLLEATRVHGLRLIVPTHELAAAFMAQGYARTNGTVGVLFLIPGPGVAYSVAAIAEARHDSAALLVITTAPRRIPGTHFGLQDIDQLSLLRGITKAFLNVTDRQQLAARVAEAYSLAGSGEPGPVVVEIAPELLLERAAYDDLAWIATTHLDCESVDTGKLTNLVEELGNVRRPLLFLGQGASDGAKSARGIAERLGCPVVTTCSGRGIMSEAHPLVLVFDRGRGGPELLNELLERADLVLAVGCKWTHNGSSGYQMHIPSSKLIRVDASPEVVAGNYPAVMAFVADGAKLLEQLDAALCASGVDISGWTSAELGAVRARLAEQKRIIATEDPRIGGVFGCHVEQFFRELQDVLPDDTRLVTDSGFHQFLARTYFTVQAPRGLLAPIDFQSMGFGLPAAIGAKIASPSSETVAVIGDGGFLMSGMEILTAIREGIDLTIAVFVDGHYGLIRSHQVGRYGRATGDQVLLPDLAIFAAAVGARHHRFEPGQVEALRGFFGQKGVRLLEVPLGDSAVVRAAAAGRAVGGVLRRRLGARRIGWMKSILSKLKR